MTPCFTREGGSVLSWDASGESAGGRTEALGHLGPPKASRVFQHPPPGAGRKNMKSLWSAV